MAGKKLSTLSKLFGNANPLETGARLSRNSAVHEATKQVAPLPEDFFAQLLGLGEKQ